MRCLICLVAAVVVSGAAGCGRIGFDASRDAAGADAGPDVLAPRAFVAGDDHGCLRDDGALICWGQNDHSQVAPTAGDVLVPTATAGAVRWHDVALGQNHTCALARDGRAWCWGENDAGQLGLAPATCGNGLLETGEACEDGNTANGDACNAVCSGAALPADATMPAPLPDERTFTRIFAGDFTTCAIATDATLWCWGRNTRGQLGLGDLVDRGRPAQVHIAEEPARDTQWRAAAIGDAHACGVQRDDTLWCWGGNASGELGIGSVVDRATPARVDGAWRTVGLGGAFTCALDTAGALYCWGENGTSQLGLGDVASRDRPARVGTARWDALAIGHFHACALADGRMACWGNNDSGEVGNGTPSVAEVSPVELAGTWRHADAGDDFTCALDDGGAGWCWGAARSGRLGNGSTTLDSAVPIRTF